MRLLLEAARAARSQPVSSTVTLLVVGSVCAVILSTTGQTVQAENAVLSRIDDAGTRSITVTDSQGRAGIGPDAIRRIEALSGVEWVVGLGPATDVRAVGLRGGQPVAVRTIYGLLPSVIKTSDWIIDMGPEGGAGGGTLVASGTPEDVAANPDSYTGHFLAECLGVDRPKPKARNGKRRKVSA